MSFASPRTDGAPQIGHLRPLDGLRAVAVLAVMGYHAGLPGFHGGRVGVDVFFVISGFLITSLLLEERARTGRISLGAFYMRRLLRLYPALLVALAAALALSALKVPVFDATTSSFEATLRAVPFTLLYSVNIARAADWASGGFMGHAWSLAIEEQFYLAWPLVVVLLLRRRSPALIGWVALACAVTSAALRTGLTAAGFDEEMLYNATFSHVDGIFAGCALAVFWRLRPSIVANLQRSGLTIAALLVLVAVVLSGEHLSTFGYSAVVVATLVVLIETLERPRSALASALSHRSAVAIGRRSYGLYLFHWPIFLFLGVDTRPHVLLLAFGLSFAVTWASYAVVEQPFLRMKQRWAASSGQDVVVGVAQEPARRSG